MNEKVQNTLNMRRTRKSQNNDPSYDKHRAKVDAALRVREERITSNIESIWNDVRGRYEAVVDTYNKSNKNLWRKTASEIQNGQRENTIATADLLRQVQAYRKYFGNEATDSILNSLHQVKRGQDAIYTNAAVFSQFENEDDFQEYLFRSSADNSQGRQQRYVDNKAQIDDLEDYYKHYYTIDLWYQDYLENPGNYAAEEAQEYLAKYERHNAYKQKYGSLDDVKAEIDRLDAENRKYERGEENYVSKVVDDYHVYTENPDFEIDSANREYTNATEEELWSYDMSVREGSVALNGDCYLDEDGNVVDRNGNIVMSAHAPVVEDKLAMFLQATNDDITEAYNRLLVTNGDYADTWANLIREGDHGSWRYLKEKEIGIYYYLLGNDGQEAAYKYLDDMKTELNRRQTLYETGQYPEAYDNAGFWGKVGMNIVTVPTKLVSGVAGFVENTANKIMDNEINPYSSAHSGMHYSNTIRGKTAEELDNTGIAIPGLDFTLGDAYQSGMSMLDSLAAVGIGGKAGSALLAMGAAQNEAYRLYQQGASSSQIAWGSALAGGAEMVFEAVSIGRLIDTKDIKTVGQWVKNALIQGGVEATEEGFTEIANTLTNAIVMGSQSDWSKLVEENNGDTRKAFLSKVQDVAHSSFGGFLSGGGSGAIAGGVSYANTISDNIKENKQFKATYGTSISDLISEALEINPDNVLAQKLKAKLNNGKDISGREIKALVDANTAAIEIQDNNAIQQAIQKRLAELGETENITAISAALAKQSTGQNLTQIERQLISDSWYGERVANELNPENIRSGDYTSAWVQQIGLEGLSTDENNSTPPHTFTDREILEQVLFSTDTQSLNPHIREDVRSYETHLQQKKTIESLLQKQESKLKNQQSRSTSEYEQQKTGSGIEKLKQLLSREQQKLQALENKPSLQQFLKIARSQMSALDYQEVENRRKNTVVTVQKYGILNKVDLRNIDIIANGTHLERGKLKPDVFYRTGEHDYVYQTDNKSRICRVFANKLQLKTHKERPNHARTTPGKLPGDEAGHLIADWFGGSRKLDNLVSQAKMVNRTEFGDLEKMWAAALENGQEVSLDIRIFYNRESGRPKRFHIVYSIDGRIRERTVHNNQEAIDHG